jgi:ribosome-binding factor A
MRGYDRTDRLNELLIRILAEELEIIDDEVLGFVTVTGVQTDKSLTQAKVFVTGELNDKELCSRLETHRSRLQRAINQQSRLRRVPSLSFFVDDTVESAERIENLLRELNQE